MLAYAWIGNKVELESIYTQQAQHLKSVLSGAVPKVLMLRNKLFAN